MKIDLQFSETPSKILMLIIYIILRQVSSHLEEQSVLLTTKPTLQPWNRILKLKYDTVLITSALFSFVSSEL